MIRTTSIWTALFLVAVFAACSDPVDDGAAGPDLGSDVVEDDAGDAGEDVADSAEGDAQDVAEDVDTDADVGDVPDESDVADQEDVADLADVPDVPEEDPCEGVEPGPELGIIEGDCGFVDAALLAQSAPAFFMNSIDFGEDPYDDADLCRLSEGGREVVLDDNAGGSSKLSEAFAFEVLDRCERAELLKTENEVVYTDPMGKLTDLLVSFDGQRVGVSVTRAVGFPRDDPYTVERAQELLEDKLEGVLASSANVAQEDAWEKQILHVVAYGPMHAESMRSAWDAIDDEIRADTIVIVTVSDGEDEWLY